MGIYFYCIDTTDGDYLKNTLPGVFIEWNNPVKRLALSMTIRCRLFVNPRKEHNLVSDYSVNQDGFRS